ncbi:ABC transporter substrate-binding protein [Alicyclobacillus hesperidum]|uniref:ABC transporter substrate-binding protein n=1 Tax=Alicyclobacillus hesperidum TaxID=89784 RepID=UPI002490FC12|nr:ABC transporter substrate-binding protein [Alicyclobacillus hesperidum]
MNNIRRPLVYFGVLCTAGTLATGCGTTNIATKANTVSSSHISDQSVMGAASRNPITIAFWYGVSNNLSNDIQQMVAEFNRTHPNIRVVATYEGSYSGGGEEQQKLLAAIKAGDPPAIAQIEVHAMPVFAASGQLVDLTSLLRTSSIDKPSNFLDGILVSTQYQGRYYGVPFNRSVPVLYYNETLFRQAGITRPPTNWTQLMPDAKALTKGAGSHKIYGFAPLVDWWPWEYAVLSSGGTILSHNLTEATFAKPNALTILNAQAQLVKEGNAKVEAGPNAWDLMTQDFINGEVAMDIDSIGSASKVASGVGLKFSWNTALLPRGKTLAVPPGGGDLAILKGVSPAQQQAAWTFIQWWTAPAQSVKWSIETGYLPVQKVDLANKTYMSFIAKHPQYRTAIDELKYEQSSPASPAYLAVLEQVQQALEGIFDEGKPVAPTMEQTAEQVNQNLG